MTIKVAKTPDGIVVRRITATSEIAYRKHFDGSWALCSGHKGPWVSLNAIDVPGYALREIAAAAERGDIQMLATVHQQAAKPGIKG